MNSTQKMYTGYVRTFITCGKQRRITKQTIRVRKRWDGVDGWCEEERLILFKGDPFKFSFLLFFFILKWNFRWKT